MPSLILASPVERIESIFFSILSTFPFSLILKKKKEERKTETEREKDMIQATLLFLNQL